LLTLYLGDGCKHPRAFGFSAEGRIEYYEITVVPEIVRRAYETGYSKLLDAIKCDKWLALKNLMPKRDLVHARFNEYVFCLNYFHSKIRTVLFACTVTKSEEEARRCAQLLALLGMQAKVYKWPRRYWIVQLNGREVLKLAEPLPEWRNALRELAEKRKIEPRGPVARRLLELAGSPPLPWQNFKALARGARS
jgi:hypothetical protein